MPIDDDISEILDLDEDEKLIHTLHRTWLSVAMTIIFGALMLFLIIMGYAGGNIFQLFSFAPHMVWVMLVAPFAILIIGILIGVGLGKWYAGGHLFLITNKRILFYTKFVSKNLRELRFNKITDSVFSQGPIGRIFKYSNITLSTPGMEGGMGLQGMATFFFSIKGIHDGLDIRQHIQELIDGTGE